LLASSRQVIVLHDGDDQGVAGEQFRMLTPGSRYGNQSLLKGHDLNSHLTDHVHCLSKRVNFWTRWDVAQVRGDALAATVRRAASRVITRWATSLTTCAELKPWNFLARNPIHKLQASRAVVKSAVSSHQRIGVEKQSAALQNAGEGHGDSRCRTHRPRPLAAGCRRLRSSGEAVALLDGIKRC